MSEIQDLCNLLNREMLQRDKEAPLHSQLPMLQLSEKFLANSRNLYARNFFSLVTAQNRKNYGKYVFEVRRQNCDDTQIGNTNLCANPNAEAENVEQIYDRYEIDLADFKQANNTVLELTHDAFFDECSWNGTDTKINEFVDNLKLSAYKIHAQIESDLLQAIKNSVGNYPNGQPATPPRIISPFTLDITTNQLVANPTALSDMQAELSYFYDSTERVVVGGYEAHRLKTYLADVRGGAGTLGTMFNDAIISKFVTYEAGGEPIYLANPNQILLLTHLKSMNTSSFNATPESIKNYVMKQAASGIPSTKMLMPVVIPVKVGDETMPSVFDLQLHVDICDNDIKIKAALHLYYHIFTLNPSNCYNSGTLKYLTCIPAVPVCDPAPAPKKIVKQCATVSELSCPLAVPSSLFVYSSNPVITGSIPTEKLYTSEAQIIAATNIALSQYVTLINKGGGNYEATAKNGTALSVGDTITVQLLPNGCDPIELVITIVECPTTCNTKQAYISKFTTAQNGGLGGSFTITPTVVTTGGLTVSSYDWSGTGTGSGSTIGLTNVPTLSITNLQPSEQINYSLVLTLSDGATLNFSGKYLFDANGNLVLTDAATMLVTSTGVSYNANSDNPNTYQLDIAVNGSNVYSDPKIQAEDIVGSFDVNFSVPSTLVHVEYKDSIAEAYASCTVGGGKEVAEKRTIAPVQTATAEVKEVIMPSKPVKKAK